LREEQMKNFLIKNKISITVSFYLLGIFLLLRFATIPYINGLKSRADSIQEKIIDNRMEGDRLEDIPRMEELYGNYLSNENFIDVILNQNEQLSLIKSLEDLAENTGNKINLKAEDSESASRANNAKKAETKNKDKDKEEKSILDNLPYDSYFPMEITLEGDYRGLVNFIRKLESFNYYVNVISISSKSVIQSSEDGAVDRDSSRNIFISSDSVSAVEEKNEKEIINSVIKVVVYVKK